MTTIGHDRLKPCPFCGKRAPVRVLDSNELEGVGPGDEGYESNPDHAVVCSFTDGGCGASSGYRSTGREAVEAWNRRGGERLADLIAPEERTCRNVGGESDTNFEYYDFGCSECGYAADVVNTNFCPNCGAKVVADV